MVRANVIFLIAGLTMVACSSSTSDAGDASGDAGAVDSGIDDSTNPLPGCPRDPGPEVMDFDPTSVADPIGDLSTFTMEKALAGYPKSGGVLTALITTDLGPIRCELDEAAAPMSVANFVGLARGTRPFKFSGAWRLQRFYDGLLWHRIVPGSVIVSGDPTGTGNGGPGYMLRSENRVAESLGTLATSEMVMPSGSQFHIVVGDGVPAKFNVFGKCDTATALAIAALPRTEADRPLKDVHIRRVHIARCPKK